MASYLALCWTTSRLVCVVSFELACIGLKDRHALSVAPPALAQPDKKVRIPNKSRENPALMCYPPYMEKLTHEALLDALNYNPETGEFYWRKYRWTNGNPAGHYHKKTGYIKINVGGQPRLAHRLAWFYVHAIWPKEQIDHINGDRTDNRLTNLREASRTENMRNCKRKVQNKSGYKGVHWFKKTRKWRASITVNRRNISLGLFADPKEAYKAYCEAAIKYHGAFARG